MLYHVFTTRFKASHQQMNVIFKWHITPFTRKLQAPHGEYGSFIPTIKPLNDALPV